MIALGPQVLNECLVPQLETYIVRVTEQMQQARNAANAATVVRRTVDLKVRFHLRLYLPAAVLESWRWRNLTVTRCYYYCLLS